MARLSDKRAVFVVAFRNFRDEELLEPKAALEAEGAKVLVASSALGTAEGMLGARVAPDLLYTAVRVDDLDALVFIGGEGAAEYWDDRAAHKLAREAQAKGKVLGAICFAPSTLANAGLLEGRKATCYSTRKGHLQSRGAIVTGEPATRDGRLVTGEGPAAAKAFGAALVEALGA
jgi:protease I